jgi:hypothetical protein
MDYRQFLYADTTKPMQLQVLTDMKNKIKSKIWDFSPKRRFTQYLHGATSQKAAVFKIKEI